jgi:subtilisin family serine protease
MPLTFKPLGNASAKMRAHEHTARRESFRVPVENLRGLILAGSLLSGYASGACTLPAEPVVPAIAGKVNTHASINASSDTNVTVSVLSIAPRVAAIIKAQRVTLRQGSKVYTLAEVGNQYMLTAPEGWYTLEVTVNHLHVPSRQVEVRGKSQSITVFATDPDNKLYFRAGEQLVPFRPLARYQSQLELEATSHVPFSASWPAPSTGNAYIVSSRNPQLAWTGIVADLRTALTKQYPNADVRVGVPVDTGGGEFQALDRRFFVRFARGVTYAERSDWLAARKARTLGLLDNDMLWIEFAGDDYRENLCEIEQAFAQGLLQVGQPDLLLQFAPQGPLPDDWPDDPAYRKFQINRGSVAKPTSSPHAVQRVRHAWNLLAAWLDPGSGFFSNFAPPRWRHKGNRSDVVLGVVDYGFNLEVAEFACDAVARYVDIDNITARCERPRCAAGTNNSSCAPDSCFQLPHTHGMGTAGIAFACTNNNIGIAGILPAGAANLPAGGFKAVLAKIPASTSGVMSESTYRNLLNWMAGRPFSSIEIPATRLLCPPLPHPAPPNINAWIQDTCAKPLSTPARVINLSIYSSVVGNNPPVLSDLFENLADEGVYTVHAAGNHGLRLADDNVASAYAGYPSSISAGNCTVEWTNRGPRIRLSTWKCAGKASNWGGFTVCALGNNTPTIDAYCAGSLHSNNDDAAFAALSCPPVPDDICTFHGTSAAAPTVSGAVALMLAANRDLTFTEVKDILKTTADKSMLALDGLGLPLTAADLTIANAYGDTGLLDVCRAVEEAIARKVTPAGVPKRAGGKSYCED